VLISIIEMSQPILPQQSNLPQPKRKQQEVSPSFPTYYLPQPQPQPNLYQLPLYPQQGFNGNFPQPQPQPQFKQPPQNNIGNFPHPPQNFINLPQPQPQFKQPPVQPSYDPSFTTTYTYPPQPTPSLYIPTQPSSGIFYAPYYPHSSITGISSHTTILVHILPKKNAQYILQQINEFETVEDIYDKSIKEHIQFDTTINRMDRIVNRLSPTYWTESRDFVWPDFYNAGYGDGLALLNRKNRHGVWNHVFLACYFADDWLSLEEAVSSLENIASLCTKVPFPPAALISIDRGVPAAKPVKIEDAELVTAKFNIPLFETKIETKTSDIENKKFSNSDIYLYITSARPYSYGNMRA